MQSLKLLAIPILSALLFSCSGNKTSAPASANSSSQALTNSAGKENDSTVRQEDNNSSPQANSISSQQILDTNKMKSDMSAVTDLLNGKPDTNKLKNAAADILSTDAAILSDSGISKMYGNSNDPSVNTAKNMLIKMRNSIGITPGKLDSMKKSAAMLSNDSIGHH
jgi:hypothetical protein